MTVKYECHNQLTGNLEEALDFEAAKVLRDRLKAEYIAANVDHLFQITVLVQNEDGSWTQSLADENGQPLLAATPEPTEQATEEPAGGETP